MKHQNEKTGFEIAIEIIFKYRGYFILLLVAVVILISIFALSYFINSSNNDKADRQFDLAEQNISALANDTNIGERSEMIQQQMQSFLSLIQVYPRTIAAERARLLIGKFYFETFYTTGNQQLLLAAYSNYNYALLAARSDFYRTLALIGRAQCSEQQNGYVKAFEDYNQVATKYTNQGFAPLALISMARCREQMSDIPGAIDYYKQLIKEYPDSEWNYFARGKLYFYTEKFQNQSSNTNLPFLSPLP